MATCWFISDTHFGHKNILNFEYEGEKLRPFETIEEMDELLIENWNKRVAPNDRVYHLGDVAIHRRAIQLVGRCNGRKVLIKGNHDDHKLKDYAPFFQDIRAYKLFRNFRMICSHIPIHPQQLKNRYSVNVHGHLHQHELQDHRYVNVCVEHTNYTPISLEEVNEIYMRRKEEYDSNCEA